MIFDSNKKFLFFGILGWVILSFFSFWNFKEIALNKCYFLSSWPQCGMSHSVAQIIFKFSVLSVAFLVLSFFSFLALKNWKDNFKDKKLFIVSGLVFLLAFITLPFASSDLQFYFSLGKAVTNNINPYIQNWSVENSFFYPPSISQLQGVMYGPIALDFFKVAYAVSRDNVLNFIVLWKILMSIVFILCGYLLSLLVGKDQGKASFYGLWLSQPLVLFEWIGNGHFDGLWIVCVLLAFIFAKEKKWWLAAIMLTLGIWVKFIPLFFLPWFALWWYQESANKNWLKNSFDLIGGLVLFGSISTLVWWQYWQGLKVFNSLVLQSKWAVNSLFATLYYSSKSLLELFTNKNVHWFLTRFLHVFLLVILLYFFVPVFKQIYKIFQRKLEWSAEQYMSASFVSLLSYILIWQKSLWPWYFVWLIPIGLVVYIKSQNIFIKKILVWITSIPVFFYLPWMMSGGDATGLQFFWYVFLGISFYPLYQLYCWRKIDYKI